MEDQPGRWKESIQFISSGWGLSNQSCSLSTREEEEKEEERTKIIQIQPYDALRSRPLEPGGRSGLEPF